DFAYQGFGDGLFEDAGGLHALADACDNFLVCSSFSKNFGLYRDRCGALTVVAAAPEVADAVQSQVKAVVRRNYSNPPAHGPGIVTTVLDDPELRTRWEAELTAMRDRIHAMRHAFAAGLDDRGVRLSAAGNDFVVHQRGMFTMSGLTTKQVATLRESHSIYIVGSGRINVAGMTDDNLPRLCDAIAEVTSLVGADFQI
ncbi:MAG: aminotransferase class I/II-fold pyridoxal phosphate-dependent enzyme, partial [Planctomycetota bacterium]